jgi:protein-S-isoprenylcysteine O-methyltransferase Ste14
MALTDEMESNGRWLFRWRSYVPLPMYVLVFWAMTRYRYPLGEAWLDHVWEAFCVLVSLAGVAVRVLVSGYQRHGQSGRHTKRQVAHELASAGPYSLCRHPLYLGNYLMWLGIALYPRDLWVALVVSLVYWVYYERIMIAEEGFVRERFGAAFDAWAAKTPAFLPALRSWRKPDQEFSWRNVLRREYSGVFALVVSFTALEVVGEHAVHGRWTLSTGWIAIFALGAVGYLTLRTLKHRTRLLSRTA